MDPIEAARKRAARIHREIVADGGDPWQPFDIVVRAIATHDLWHQPVQAGDVSLHGCKARIDPDTKGILYGETGTAGGDALLIGHELGHVAMHGCTDPVLTHHTDPSRSAESGTAVEKLVDYGRGERREVQADLFARELVLPRSVARDRHAEGMSVADIAARLGITEDVVTQQLLDALLLPPVPDAVAVPSGGALRRDPSQDIAVAHRGSPYLLQAGPGTGKTRTLIRRVTSLIDEGVDPNGILVLTFSNKAAGELMDRLALSHPEAAASVWIGTFHAFGLDIVRRFHDRLRLPASPRLVDKATAITMLEGVIPSLALDHYRDLWDPEENLADILAAISRAKDELVDHVRYAELAEAMERAATDDATRLRAKRAAEEALVYAAYERLLADSDALDFGDLIMKPVRLMADHPQVARALALRHRHILVDEYQDVNFATVRLIAALAADEGERLWVVGDARQSIYRFRGATSASMGAFKDDYPKATDGALTVNYRSRGEIIDTFSAFASSVEAFRRLGDLRLTADRGACGRRPVMHEAGTPDDEIALVAASVAEANDGGIDYRDQAILCTANDRLAAFAAGLTARNIPVLYLGPLFERPEIKDLLSLLALFHDPRAATLVRVAMIPEVAMGLGDVALVAVHLREAAGGPLAWLEDADALPGLSLAGRESLRRLRDACGGFEARAHPWNVASALVLDRLGIARRIGGATTLADRMAGVAVWQFLNFLRSLPIEGEFPTSEVSRQIRRLIRLNEERSLRQFPDAALELDAVRLMTIHGSKGLEFDLVHAPGMIATGLPRSAKAPDCPPPDGLIAGSAGLTGLQASVAGHEEQEACLFFVLLSRARDGLRLYRSTLQKGGARRRNPSAYNARIAATLDPAPPIAPLPAPPAAAAPPPVAVAWSVPVELDHQHLDSYGKCGLRFLYTYVLGLGGRRDENPYIRMHNAVRAMIDWLDRNFDAAQAEPAGFAAAFDGAWEGHGPAEHGHANAYRQIAEEMLRFLVGTRAEEGRQPPRALRLGAGGGHVLSRAHDVVRTRDGRLVVRRVATRKAMASLEKEIEYAILDAAAEQAFGEPVTVEAIHLTGATRRPVPPDKRAELVAAVAQHMADVGAGRFAPNPGRGCLRCPHLFACPGLPAGGAFVRHPLSRER
ncbi:DNA helicase-2/ATP-dependent DNA helicase PcrA [Methylobacterium sp. PvP062]|uniref:DNA 3'-5' helicase n=4 Tax=Methylobacterium TaxID=407 RepID=A0ABV1R6G3_9HYPH|nr:MULTISPECIES: UvrD-helicase domain-containing protein [Methylobacterium]MBE7196193.1 UvrD-helicase domain-containing protein [Parafilimonas terrae]MCX7334609.1 UvrD-helicase domain-containing protein [Hyphomicrobiales bacterium]MWV20738.1 AAA family ATPase [Methylobacterium sp. 2A]AWV15211.1 DNA helicase UvrD [Methylobacterium sp. XJLW]KIU27102.1 DNA helicase UvrD [Methylobacterium radiotolerans]